MLKELRLRLQVFLQALVLPASTTETCGNEREYDMSKSSVMTIPLVLDVQQIQVPDRHCISAAAPSPESA